MLINAFQTFTCTLCLIEFRDKLLEHIQISDKPVTNLKLTDFFCFAVYRSYLLCIHLKVTKNNVSESASSGQC